MNPNPRQTDLLDEVRRQGSASVGALSERFGVTLQTVRRDEVRLAAALSQFNRPAMVEAGHVSQLDRLYTDQPPPPFGGLLAEAGITVSVGGAGAGDTA